MDTITVAHITVMVAAAAAADNKLKSSNVCLHIFIVLLCPYTNKLINSR